MTTTALFALVRSRSRGTERLTVLVLIASLAALLLGLIGTAADRAGVDRWRHPGNGTRRVDSRIVLARLLLVLVWSPRTFKPVCSWPQSASTSRGWSRDDLA